MFKIYKPHKKTINDTMRPSSMPHRNNHFDIQSLTKVNHKTGRINTYDKQNSLNRKQNLTSQTSRQPKKQTGSSLYKYLSNKMVQKQPLYSSLNGLNQGRQTNQAQQSLSSKRLSSLELRKGIKSPRKTQISHKAVNQQKVVKRKNKHDSQQISLFSDRLTGEYCTVKIFIKSREICTKFKIRKIQGFIKFLKQFIRQHQKYNSQQFCQIISFQTIDYNLQIDYYLTLNKQDGSFLNGTTLSLRPIYQNIQPIITLNSFQIIQSIGSGGFSTVYLCRFKQTGKYYAMKVINKDFIIQNQKKKIVMNQRNIMIDLNNQQFLAKLYFAFQSYKHIVFVMEYYQGGQLFNLVKRYRKMNQNVARFYIIEILLGLQKIHEKGIVYRDFKPQNIMIDIDGHVSIADFGLAKPSIHKLSQRAYSFCGSPQYMPPQMILKQGHSLPVDFYCLGALLYQLVTGLPPFYSTDAQCIYQSTLSQPISFPDHTNLSPQLMDLLQSLLWKEQTSRLGTEGGVQEILKHQWFSGIDQKEFLQRKVKAPTQFRNLDDLNFNIDQMQNDNQKHMKQILKHQKLQISAKYLKVMNGFYYDSRNNHQLSYQQIQPMISKNLRQISSQKSKHQSSSIAMTSCTKRSKQSLMNLGKKQEIQSISNLFKKKKARQSLVSTNRKSTQRILFKNLNNYF